MPIVKWMDSFSVQNKKIDDQHKKWIEIYNRAHDRMMDIIPEDETRDIGEAALEEMIEYTKYHFSSEEEFMKKIGFPGYEAHRKIHQNFVRKLKAIFSEMQKGTYIINSEIVKVIENWLIDHILTEDQKITKEFK